MRIIFLVCGHLSLAIGIVGAFLPILPTTPFVLLAAYFYSKGSVRFHRWIYAHPKFGRILLDWQKHGVIRIRAKIISTFLVLCSLAFLLLLGDFHWGLKISAGCIGFCVLSFILSRPSVPKQAAQKPSDESCLQNRDVA